MRDEPWIVSLVMHNDKPLELSREPSRRRGLVRAKAEIRVGRYGGECAANRISSEEVRFEFPGGEVVVRRIGAPPGGPARQGEKTMGPA